MSKSSPLLERHEAFVSAESTFTSALAGARRPGAAVGGRRPLAVEWLEYGPVHENEPALRIVATYGAVEAEYASIRRSAGMLDAAHRGTIVVRGADRIAFLNRMVTQQLIDLTPGLARPSFWLNRKGRIDADLLIAHLGGDSDGPGEIWIDVDRHHAASTAAALASFVFADDVQIEDRSESLHRIALHGAAAPAILSAVVDTTNPLESDRQAARLRLSGVLLTAVRRDQCGEPGYELSMAVSDVAAVWDALMASRTKDRSVRPIGWYAYNIARVESGTPLFNIDFDTTTLPHESGVLRDRVSFVKGCYLGQEVVARMESLGKPKQILVGLRIESESGGGVLPEAMSTVCAVEPGADQSEPAVGPSVGAVTSSTLSPMLAAAPIAMAMVRTAHASAGNRLWVFGEGERAIATVGALRAWGGPNADGGAAA